MKESPEKPAKKQKTGPRQPSLPEPKLSQLPDSNMQLNMGSTPNIPISQVQVLFILSTLQHGTDFKHNNNYLSTRKES